MDQAALRKSWDVYLKNFGLVFGATIAAGAISGVTFGILAGPLMAGLAVLLLSLLRGQKAEFNQLFSQFEKFLPTFLIVLVTGVAAAILSLVNYIPVVGAIIYPAVASVLFVAAFYSIVGVVGHNQAFPGALQFGASYLISHPSALFAAAAFGLVLGLVSLLFWVSWWLGLLFSWIVYLAYAFASPLLVLYLLNIYQESGVVTAEQKVDTKTVQIVGICLGALALVGLIFLIIGGSRFTLGSSRVSRLPGFGVIETKDDQGNSVSFGVGVKLPKGFPKDVPIYPGSTVFSSASGNDREMAAVLNAEVSTTKAYEYYLTELARKGWTVGEQTSSAFGSTIEAQKGTRKVVVLVLGSEEASTITITLPKE